MTGIRVIGVLVACLLLASCGGGSDASPAQDSETTTASAEPTPLESTECRSTMNQADAIATELETATIEDGAAFAQYEDRLTALYDRARDGCSARVLGDFGEAMSSMARVSGGYTACSFSDPMFQCDVAEDLVEGTGLIHAAVASANATN